jgi:hypothetical protein
MHATLPDESVFLHVQSIIQGPLDAQLGPYITERVHNKIKMANGL